MEYTVKTFLFVLIGLLLLIFGLSDLIEHKWFSGTLSTIGGVGWLIMDTQNKKNG